MPRKIVNPVTPGNSGPQLKAGRKVFKKATLEEARAFRPGSNGVNSFKIRAKVWLYPGMAGWHFVSVPKKETKEISERFGVMKRGWGSLPVVVTIGKTSWRTSIFPDRKTGTYLLPLKSDVRKKEGIANNDTIMVAIEVQV